ncbi:hypothetical protein L195_g026254 [Trifolium pratense]|uniref:Uncharacterized protein n=1 Tax=Trifolium pratense TaxID=57577 RepID=A0A2K3NIT1_TRIPR|nr:hypothetical protein L195_g026254 [Trifolium pratense]
MQRNCHDDSNASKVDRHKDKVNIKLCQKPKLEGQRNVDAKTVDEPPKVDVVAPKVDFRIEFTLEMKFEQHEQMLSWVRDLAVKLRFLLL